tara:strand:+ start:9845 stop:10147 length:303 start_codon:yes stop_codon:yes gene_type:complete
MSKIKTMSDGYNFFTITKEQAERVYKAEAFSLYAIFDDDSESLLESLDEIVEAFDMGVDVGIEIGHIKKPKVGTWFHKAEKILKDGHWYAKITDINNTNV